MSDRPRFTPAQLLSTRPDLPDPTGPLVDMEELDDTPTGGPHSGLTAAGTTEELP
jgi:hypothetical protein